jgi:hypothetical protein
MASAIGGGAIAGAAGGALSAGITGGDVGRTALIGGALGGLSGGLNFDPAAAASGAASGSGEMAATGMPGPEAAQAAVQAGPGQLGPNSLGWNEIAANQAGGAPMPASTSGTLGQLAAVPQATAVPAAAAATAAPTPWFDTGIGALNKAQVLAQQYPIPAALGGLALLQSATSSPAKPATASTAQPNRGALWNSPLPTYSNVPRAATAAPADYSHGKQAEWLYFDPRQPVAQMKRGGRAGKAGLSSLRKGRNTPPGGQDDRVPAVLAKDEYVVPADVVAHLGDGSSNAGGQRLDQMVSGVRRHKSSAGDKFPPRAKSPLAYVRG